MMMLNLLMLILSNKEKGLTDFSTSTSISTLDTYNPTVLLIFTILLQIILHLHYCFLVQWTTQMVTILESRCPIFISMKPKKITTLNSYNKIRQTQLNTYNHSTTQYLIPQVHLLLQPIRALSRSDNYYYYFALTKLSCLSMIFGLIKTAHSLQRQTDDDNDENENCTNPTQKTKKTKFSIYGLISATKISMMIKMMKAKKYLIFFQNPQFNLFSSFRLSFSQNPHKRYYARYMYKKIMMLKTIHLILLFFE
jgi:hypothetical protein